MKFGTGKFSFPCPETILQERGVVAGRSQTQRRPREHDSDQQPGGRIFPENATRDGQGNECQNGVLPRKVIHRRHYRYRVDARIIFRPRYTRPILSRRISPFLRNITRNSTIHAITEIRKPLATAKVSYAPHRMSCNNPMFRPETTLFYRFTP